MSKKFKLPLFLVNVIRSYEEGIAEFSVAKQLKKVTTIEELYSLAYLAPLPKNVSKYLITNQCELSEDEDDNIEKVLQLLSDEEMKQIVEKSNQIVKSTVHRVYDPYKCLPEFYELINDLYYRSEDALLQNCKNPGGIKLSKNIYHRMFVLFQMKDQFAGVIYEYPKEAKHYLATRGKEADDILAEQNVPPISKKKFFIKI